jgi:hypothetical protein
MTLQEIRDATRNLIHDYPSEARAKLDATNYLLDYYINAACKIVVMDLAKAAPENFLASEDVSLPLSAGGLKTCTVNAVGSGYTDGDQVLAVGGAGSGGKLHVTIASNALSVINSVIAVGSGYAVATGVATTQGGGTGAKVNVTVLCNASPAVALSAAWLQIWQIFKKSDMTPIPYVPWSPEVMARALATAAAAAPAYWTLLGKILYFFPTVSAALSTYASVYYIATETDPMAVSGPTLIPAVCQPLIALMAAIQIGVMAKVDNTKYLELYALQSTKSTALMTIPVIGQPKNLTQVAEADVPIQKGEV